MTNMIRASDAVAWEHCPRRAWYQLHPPSDEPVEPDPFEALVQTMGEEHEAAVLAQFEGAVAATSVAHTRSLMRDRAAVIYQPQLRDSKGAMFGIPDFLILDNDEYRVADAKLALSIDSKKAIKAQLGVYRRLAGSSLAPWVFLGNGEVAELDPDDDSVAEQFIEDMRRLGAQNERPATHYSYTKCTPCPFHDFCWDDFQRADEITLNPAVEARAAAALKRAGLETLSALAAADPDSIPDVPYLKGETKKRRAVLQAQSLKSGRVFRVADDALIDGDLVHFDIESDPLGGDGSGEVYLWGFLVPAYGDNAFEYVWRDRDDETCWRDFLTKITELRARFEKPVLVHYSNYERAQIARYAERYSDEENAEVRWMLDAPDSLFDLQKYVKQQWVLPVMSYGLKSICRDRRLVNFQWRLEESGSQWSVVRFYDYLAAMDDDEAQAIREEILIYNEDDVRATAALVEWIKHETA